METERKLVEYILDGKFEELPEKPVEIVKNVVLTVLGSAIAGATNDDAQKVVDLVKEWGGKQEATILLYGGKVPAVNAALANGTISRCMDFEDAMLPGIHIGPVAVPAALAAAELAGGCSGKEFLTSEHTLAHFKEVWSSDILLPVQLEGYDEKKILDKCEEAWRENLKKYEPPEWPKEKVKALNDVLARAKKELL